MIIVYKIEFIRLEIRHLLNVLVNNLFIALDHQSTIEKSQGGSLFLDIASQELRRTSLYGFSTFNLFVDCATLVFDMPHFIHARFITTNAKDL